MTRLSAIGGVKMKLASADKEIGAKSSLPVGSERRCCALKILTMKILLIALATVAVATANDAHLNLPA